MFKKVLIGLVSVCVGVISVFCFTAHYYWSALSAAKNSINNIDKNPSIIAHISRDWAQIYLFETKQGTYTVLATKDGMFWHNAATVIPVHSQDHDKVRLTGWMSYRDGSGHMITFMNIKSADTNVSYIEAGSGTDRVKHNVQQNSATFEWENTQDVNSLKATAYSSIGEPLYEYRAPNNTNSIHVPDDIRWYPLNGAL